MKKSSMEVVDSESKNGKVAREYAAKLETLPADELLDDDAPAPRPQWGNKWEFILSHIGCCIGLGNVWRFPYVCYKNGGGAFFIPYLICLFTTGIPIVFLEIAVGQYFATGGISCWDVSPIFRGIGYGTTLMAGWLNVYYIVVLSWGLLYLFYTIYYASSGPVPWSTCGNVWNTDDCISFNKSASNFTGNSTIENGRFTDHALSAKRDPTTQFWERHILDISGGIDEVGDIQWPLAITLGIVWIVCYFCIWKGVKSSGKVVYFTSLFPYVMLIILFFRGVTLPHAGDGILYYLKPDMSKLQDPKVWVGAVTQVFFSYAIALGSLTALGSYNKFDYNCFKHSMALCACDSLTSIFAGFVVFSVLGFMAHEMGVSVENVAEAGPGLAFITYPKAAAQMPYGSAVWASLFFIMLLFLGLDSQFVTMEGFFTAIMDIYPKFFRKRFRKEGFIAVMCIIWYLVGLTMITRGGMYVFELFDTYAASGMALLWFACFECLCIGWFYGANRFYDDIARMIGYRISPWMKYAWQYTGPLFTMSVMIFSIIKHQPLTYNRTYTYPPWAQAMGLLLACSSMVMIPLYAAYRLAREKGTFRERLKKAISPAIRERKEAKEARQQETLRLLPTTVDAENHMNGGA